MIHSRHLDELTLRTLDTFTMGRQFRRFACEENPMGRKWFGWSMDVSCDWYECLGGDNYLWGRQMDYEGYLIFSKLIGFYVRTVNWIRFWLDVSYGDTTSKEGFPNLFCYDKIMVRRSIKVVVCRCLEIILVRPLQGWEFEEVKHSPRGYTSLFPHSSERMIFRIWKGDLVNTSQWSHTIMFSSVQRVEAMTDWKSLWRSRASRMVVSYAV